MRILLSNDDGFNAPGIKQLAEYIEKYSKITVAAPKRNMSACSSSLSVQKEIKIKNNRDSVYSIDGTSADSVHLALRGFLEQKYHQVISGINYGSNMGDDVIYSGTVAAAIEGRSCTCTPLAISIANRNPQYTDDIRAKLDLFLPKYLGMKFEDRTILNINLPDIPYAKVKGIKITCLGTRRTSNRAKIFKNKNGLMYGTIGDVGNPKNSDKGTDFHAVKEKYISITPLTLDMTNHKLISKLKQYNGNE